MSMAYGLISDTKAPVRPGTVIKLTEANLKADPKDSASTAVKAMFEVFALIDATFLTVILCFHFGMTRAISQSFKNHRLNLHVDNRGCTH